MKERFDKLNELWSGLSSGRKTSLVVAVLGILAISVGILSWSGGSSSMRPLVSGADTEDLNDVVEVLRSNQVEFEYSESGDTILVPEDKRAAMRMELAMKGLPKSGDVGFEIFDEGNFGISDFVQRTNHTRALQGELQRTIAMMDNVKSAKVFIVKPENNLLLSEDPNDRPSASVYVDTGGNTLGKNNQQHASPRGFVWVCRAGPAEHEAEVSGIGGMRRLNQQNTKYDQVSGNIETP